MTFKSHVFFSESFPYPLNVIKTKIKHCFVSSHRVKNGLLIFLFVHKSVPKIYIILCIFIKMISTTKRNHQFTKH
jgi:hypothetical protein